MTRADVEGMAALSPMQQGILFHAVLGEGQGVYVNQHLIHLAGEVDAKHLHEAWLEVCNRHQALRSSFVWEGAPKPVQVVWRQTEIILAEVDLRAVSPESQRMQIDAFMSEDKRRGFNLELAPLMRLTLFRLDWDRHILYWCNHHLILDGWSAAIVAREVFASYAARQLGVPANLPKPTPFLNYLRWLERQDLEQAETFWRSMLQEVTPTFLWGHKSETGLLNGCHATSAAAREAFHSDKGFAQVEVRLSTAETARLAACCRQLGVTQSVFCQAAWGALLSLYTGTSDVVFGVTSSGRPVELEGVEAMVGLFISTLPLRLQISPQQTLIDLLLVTQDRNIAVCSYEFTPLPQVLSWAGAEAASPLFDTLLVFENYPVDEVLKTGSSDLRITNIEVREATNYPLTITIGPGRELKLQFTGLTDIVPAEELGHIAKRFHQHLETLSRMPNAPIGSIPWLSSEEFEHVRALGTGPKQDFGSGFVPQRIAEQARATPNRPAVTFEGETLTYAQLIYRADALAAWLTAKGIGPEQICGVLADRGIGMAVALLGVLRAGGCYLPLDPDNPQERLTALITRAAPQLVLAERRYAGATGSTDVLIACLEDTLAESEEKYTPQQRNETLELAPNNPAYCIFTSGSTGEPKAVINTHAGLWNRLHWMQHCFSIGGADTVLQKTPFTFDVSVWEFFWPWMTGARLLLARPDGQRDSAYLHDLIDREAVTTLHFVPSMLDFFLEGHHSQEHNCLRQVFCSGEALTPELAHRFFERYRCRLHNLYGPTEASIDVTWWPCDPKDPSAQMPIGHPIANMEAHVLDSALRPVPDGVHGDLYLGGIGLARGYLHRSDLTAERFVPHPFGRDGERLYRTGDVVRRRRDGAIEYLGRTDGQVKLRGFRIELGEIESALRRLEGINQVAVRMHIGSAGQQELVAYVGGSQRDAVLLRETLGKCLPGYMVPTRFVLLDRLPVNRNGKLDLISLRTQPKHENTAPKLPPQGDYERRIARLWQEVLQTDELGRDIDFRGAGGNSLLAIRLLSRLRMEFKQELPLSIIFEEPTIARLAASIESTGVSMPFEPVRRRTTVYAPLSFAQQRLWFLAQWPGGNRAYNLPLLFQVTGVLDYERLQTALQELCDRHETLHSRIAWHDHKLCMEPIAGCKLQLDLHEAKGDTNELIREQVDKPFDLATAPMMRACLIRHGEAEHQLLLVFHHIAVDGWSLQVLFREFLQMYEQQTLSPIWIRYGDVAAWEQEHASGQRTHEAEQFWREQLSSRENPLALPVEVLALMSPGSGASYHLHLSSKALSTIRGVAGDLHINQSAIIAAAFGLLLGRWSGMNRFLIGMPLAQRELPNTEQIVGLMLNTLPLRIDLEVGTVAGLLYRQQAELRNLFSHGHFPLDRILNAVQPERDAGGHSLFRVLLVMQFGVKSALRTAETEWIPLPVPTRTSKFDLTLSVDLDGDDPGCTWEYRADLFRSETIAALAQSFDTLLCSLHDGLQNDLSNLSVVIPSTDHRDEATPDISPTVQLEESAGVPAIELEAVLTALWVEILKVPSVGRHDNFFSIGGDSLLSIRICIRTTEQGIPLDVSDLFHAQTIAALAQRLLRKPKTTVNTPAPQLAVELPLSPSQAFFFRTVGEEANHYNIARLVTTSVRLSEDRWRDVAGALAERHDALRLRFACKSAAERYTIVDPFAMEQHANFQRADLSELSDREVSAAIERESDFLQRSFDLEYGPLFRLVWFDLGAHRPGRLLLLVHHLVADGLSVMLLMQDLEQFVLQAQTPQRLTLSPLRTSWTTWLQQMEVFARSPQARLEVQPWLHSQRSRSLPLDLQNGANLQESEAEITVTVARPAARIPALLMKALGTTLREWMGTDRYQYDWISNGRFPFQNSVDVSRTSGYFSTRLPVLGSWSAESSFWLQCNPLAYGAARFLSHSDVAAALASFERSAVSLNYLGDLTSMQSGVGLFSPAKESTGQDRSGRQQRACALRLFALSEGDHLQIVWKYSTNLHRRDTVERWAQRMAAAIQQSAEL